MKHFAIFKDKVARLSFVALLITMFAAMFYAPTAPHYGDQDQSTTKK